MEKMKITLVSASGNAELQKAVNAVLSVGQEVEIKFCDKMNEMETTSRIFSKTNILIILVDTLEMMNGLMKFKKWLYQRKVVLIVPDQKGQTLSMAHRLRPRVVLPAGGDYNDLAAIVELMAGE